MKDKHSSTLHTKKTAKSKVNVLNYVTPSLQKRLNDLIDMTFYKTNIQDDSDNPIQLSRSHKPDSEPLENDPMQYALFDLNVEPEPEIRNYKIDVNNWMASYSLKPQFERILWRSKVYSKVKTVSTNQGLVERTENLIDLALRKFCSWFHSVFNDEHSHITEDYIKKLFSSGFEIHPAAQSIYIEPKQIFSIPHDVAEKYNVPELSTKNQKKQLMNLEDSVSSPTSPTRHTNIAFGKCLPTSLKRPLPEIDDSMKANFPDELRTDEYLFKGIEGLRSTKFLVKHFDKPDMLDMKPLYFKNFKYEDDEKYIPLYKKLESKI